MSDSIQQSKRLAKNSFLLYIRMILVMAINLYTVRLVLQSLGAENYGIYDVVAGIITTLISLSSVLSTATQRYYSFALGENKTNKLRDIFSTSVQIYLLLSLLVLLFGETVGLWFVNEKLVIPASRMYAANWVYQCSILSFIFTFLQIPYSAAMMAHENMGVFAIISTVESILKLGIAIGLFFTSNDKLIVYAGCLLLVSALVLSAYYIWGSKNYPECHYQKPTDKTIFKELLSFSGWSFFGSIAGVGMSQGITILTNLFFGPLVNASRAIATQFNLALGSLTAGFLMAMRPQMIKAYAEESFEYLNKVFSISNKLIYYGSLVICIPLMVEMYPILLLWLKQANPQTALFGRLILVYTIIMALNNPIAIIIQATGHVKEYHIVVEIFTILCVPITYLLFKLDYQAHSMYIVMLISAVLAHVARLICLKKFYQYFSYSEYLKGFVIPAFFISIIAGLTSWGISFSPFNTFIRMGCQVILTTTVIGLLVYFIGLSKAEKNDIGKLIQYFKRQ